MNWFKTDDVRIQDIEPLISPAILIKDYPATTEIAKMVATTRKNAENIISGHDDRLLVVVGPCSIHDPQAAVDYAARLKEQMVRFEKDLVIIMRVYFEKPRTTVGWKGLINDPFMNHTFDINRGLHMARGLLLRLGDMGVPAATEFLDTITPQYIADLITWGAIGARTTESQVHRPVHARGVQERHQREPSNSGGRHHFLLLPALLPFRDQAGCFSHCLHDGQQVLPPDFARFFSGPEVR